MSNFPLSQNLRTSYVQSLKKVEPSFKTSDYVPYLTEEDFARAELVDDRALAESLSDDDNGGPLMSNGTLDEIDNRVSFGIHKKYSKAVCRGFKTFDMFPVLAAMEKWRDPLHPRLGIRTE